VVRADTFTSRTAIRLEGTRVLLFSISLLTQAASLLVKTLILLLNVAFAAALVAEAQTELRQLSSFTLQDQFGGTRACRFPSGTWQVITLADKKGSSDVLLWVNHLKGRYGDRLAIEGIADVTAVPAPLRGMVRDRFRKEFRHPVLLDWHGRAVRQLGPRKNQANVYFVGGNGQVLVSVAGTPNPESCARLFAAIDKALAAP
jgi:hypothetical protein